MAMALHRNHVLALFSPKKVRLHWQWKFGFREIVQFGGSDRSGVQSAHSLHHVTCSDPSALSYSLSSMSGSFPYTTCSNLLLNFRGFGVSMRFFAVHQNSILDASVPKHDADAPKQGLNLTSVDRHDSISYLKTLGVVDEEVLAGLIQKYPVVLSRDFEDSMIPLLRTFEHLGIRDQVAGQILRKNPQLMMRILERKYFEDNVAYLLQCGLSKEQVARVLRVYPQSLTLSVPEHIQPTIELLKELGVAEGKIGKVISLSPYYLGYRDVSLLSKIQFLESVGVKTENVAKMISEQPSILCYSVAENMMPRVEFMESVGVERRQIGKIITRYPGILTLSVDALKEKVAYFENKGLKGKSLVKLFTLHPDILGRSMDSLEARFQTLTSIGFSDSEVCEILAHHPTIIGCSEVHLREKFDFLIKSMNRSAKEVLKCTAYVTYSLEGRIKPRQRVFSWLIAQGLLPRIAYSLRTIVGGSESYFRRRFVDCYPMAASVYEGSSEVLVGRKAGDILSAKGK